MKYCPYCGAEIQSGAFSFCPECGKPLSGSEEIQTPVETKQEKKQRKHPHSSKPKREKSADRNLPKECFVPPTEISVYDGYYDDVKPIDADRQREGVDTRLILRMVLLVAGVILVIAGCTLALFLL